MMSAMAGAASRRSLRIPLLIVSFALLAAWALLQGPEGVLRSMAPPGCVAGGPADLQGGLGAASTDDAVEIITGWHAFTQASHGASSAMTTDATCLSSPKDPGRDRLLEVRNADTTVRYWLLTDLAVFTPLYGALLLLVLAWTRRLPDPLDDTRSRRAGPKPEAGFLRAIIWLAARRRLMTSLVVIAVALDWLENALLLSRLGSWWAILDRTGALETAQLRLGWVHAVGIAKWLAVLLPLLVALVIAVRQVIRAAALLLRALSRLWVQLVLVLLFAILVLVPDQGADALRRLSPAQWATTTVVLTLFVVTIVLGGSELLKPLAVNRLPARPGRPGTTLRTPGLAGTLLAALVAARWGAIVLAIGAALFVVSSVTDLHGLAIPAALVGITGVASIVLDIVDELGPRRDRLAQPSASRATESLTDTVARVQAVGRVAPCLAGVVVGAFGLATLRATAGDLAFVGPSPRWQLVLREIVGVVLVSGTGLAVLAARRLVRWAGSWTDATRRNVLLVLAAAHVPIVAVHSPTANIAIAPAVGTFSLAALFLSGFGLIGSLAARASNALMRRPASAQIALPSALRLLRLRSTPIIGLLTAWAILSPLAANSTYHAVRSRAGTSTTLLTPDQLAIRWTSAQPPGTSAAPALLVASSGGGIRAAYWTAAVLDCIVERDSLNPNDPCGGPASAEHLAARRRALLAMSGISGGSLGLAEYVAAVGAQWAGGVAAPLPARWYRDRLGRDFLAPTMAAFLFNDGANALLRPEHGVDRAAILERAWEDAADGAMSHGFFAAQTATPEPALLLNGFNVGDGCRVLTSALRTQPTADASDCTAVDTGADAPDVLSTLDLHNQLCDGRDITYATAALASARFPFISPAGHLAGCGADRSGVDIVDGGYRETSGASTIVELWPELSAALDTAFAADRPGACADPVFLQIDNGYTGQQVSGVGRGSVGFFAPLQAIMRASGGEEAAAREASHEVFAGDGHWFRITTFAHPGSTAPLGWVLSSDAQDDLEQQLAVNADTIEAIRAVLDSARPC
jgi:hypothetical protein